MNVHTVSFCFSFSRCERLTKHFSAFLKPGEAAKQRRLIKQSLCYSSECFKNFYTVQGVMYHLFLYIYLRLEINLSLIFIELSQRTFAYRTWEGGGGGRWGVGGLGRASRDWSISRHRLPNINISCSKYLPVRWHWFTALQKLQQSITCNEVTVLQNLTPGPGFSKAG